MGMVINWELCKRLNLIILRNGIPKKNRILTRKGNAENSLGLWEKTDHTILAKRPDLVFISKNKRTCQRVDFAVPVDQKVKREINTWILTET